MLPELLRTPQNAFLAMDPEFFGASTLESLEYIDRHFQAGKPMHLLSPFAQEWTGQRRWFGAILSEAWPGVGCMFPPKDLEHCFFCIFKYVYSTWFLDLIFSSWHP